MAVLRLREIASQQIGEIKDIGGDWENLRIPHFVCAGNRWSERAAHHR